MFGSAGGSSILTSGGQVRDFESEAHPDMIVPQELPIQSRSSVLLSPKHDSEVNRLNNDSRIRTFVLLFACTVCALLIQGYHPGLEDDAFYLAAIKHNLNPALFSYDADFFRLQFQATIFDKLIAASIRLTHLPIEWALLLWQFAATFLILWGCLRISRRCFPRAQALWAGVMLVAVLLTIPVSGTALSLTDQYLHPRALWRRRPAPWAAIVATLDERRLLAAVLLGAAFLTHAIMASFGVSLCIFLGWKGRKPQWQMASLLLPLGWVFQPSSDAWRQAASTRRFYFLGQWSWYEWLGVFAPLILLWWFHRLAECKELPVVSRLALRLAYFGVFQTLVALVIMLPPQFERLLPFEPMRYLQLIYLLLFLIAGGFLGQYVLGKYAYRWVLLFLPLGLGMFYEQRRMYPATAHLELPGRSASNPWVAAFVWIRQNTSVDSRFALDPLYMELPSEDFHGFRARWRSAVCSPTPSKMPAWPRRCHSWRRGGKGDCRASGMEEFQSHGLSTPEEYVWRRLGRAHASSAGMNCPYPQSGGIRVPPRLTCDRMSKRTRGS